VTPDEENSERIRALISQIIAALNQPVLLSNGDSTQPPLTFTDVVRIGVFFCKVFATIQPESGGRFTEQDLELIAEISSRAQNPDEVADLLMSRVEAGLENPEDLAKLPDGVRRFMERPYNMRQLLVTAVREMIPPNPPGRKRKINDADIPKLLRRADQLRPAIMALIQVTQASRKRPLSERIKYLEPEYPEACEYLLKYEKQLKIITDDKRLMSRAATHHSGVRLIADAIAGAEFDISPRYAIQRVQEARRAVRRRGKRTKLQKI
jgi:hypothetical protein